MTSDRIIFIKAFPQVWTPIVNSILGKIEFQKQHDPSRSFHVTVDGEQIEIPTRIYYERPTEKNLTEDEVFVLNCFFTRHHNGHVREDCLKRILVTRHYISTPYIIQLLGEYVIEILQLIQSSLDNALLNFTIKFKEENPNYFDIIEQRVQSYWDCYYKSTNKAKENYPGFQILRSIKEYKSNLV